MPPVPLLSCQPDQQPSPPGGRALAFLSVCWWLFHILIRMWSHVATLSECFCVSVAQLGALCISGALLTPSLCNACAAPPGLSAQLLEVVSGLKLELGPGFRQLFAPKLRGMAQLSAPAASPQTWRKSHGLVPIYSRTRGAGCGAWMAWATLRHPGGRENEDL